MERTPVARKEQIKRNWYVIDAEGKVLGRLASRVAEILMGKHKPIYTPNVDTGDFVVIINAGKIKVTGKKLLDKVYYRHSGYLGGLKKETLFSLISRKPEVVIKLAVKGMLPKNNLGRKMIKKLKIYKGAEHPHSAQKPEVIEI